MSDRTPSAEPPRMHASPKRLMSAEGAMPRSPAEALEPTRGPTRPRGRRPPRREARKLGPLMRALNGLLTLAAVVLLLGGGTVMWFESEVRKAGPLQASKMFVVREKEGSRDIAQRLETEGIVHSHHLFVAYYVSRSLAAMFGGRPLQLKAGEYQFEAGQSLRDVADIIGRGRSATISLTIPEGLTSWQIVERLKADQGLTGEVAVPAEGTLMPDTYRVARGTARAAVIELMQSEHRKFMEKAWTQRQSDLPVKTPEEAMILASIVEKETGRRDERERVAAVFVNRLKKNMRLQSDPTILYGIQGGQAQWGKPITRSDINARNAHNTYQFNGLPPTPICNPGRASIIATLNPAQTRELYFVADGSGGHVFSETLQDHNSAVGNWRKTEKEIRARQAEAAAAKEAAAAAAATAAAPAGAEGAGTPVATPVAASAAAIPPLPTRKPKAPPAPAAAKQK